jgi:site-specific recombinase XerD
VRYPPHPFTKEQARKIIEVAGDGTHNGKRDKAMCVMLYRTGLRCAEMCALDVEDVYPLDDGCALIRVKKPKGYALGVMPREVGIDPLSARYLFEWMSARKQKGEGPLFTTNTGARVLTSHVRRMLPILAKRSGIARRVHPHAFRHTFARELYDEGIGLVEIMLAMGHKSLATTQQYLISIGATEVVSTTIRRTW